MEIDKSNFKDELGRPVSTALFLEILYDEKYAAYTLKEEDFLYNGKLYPSIKRLYLEESDVTEYRFAKKYFLSWSQWQKICKSKAMQEHIEEWREELEVKIRADAIVHIVKNSGRNAASARWLADRGWAEKSAGRPSKEEIQKKIKIAAKINSEYDDDVKRMLKVV